MSDFDGAPLSWTSSSIPCSEDDMSEMDNDYFFLVEPSGMARRPSLLRVSARSAQDAIDVINSVQSELPVTFEPLRPRSITLYDEDFADSTPSALPTLLESPVSVATHSFDDFHAAKEEAQPHSETRSLPDQLEDDETPLQGLDLEDLEMYLDEEGEEDPTKSGGSNKFYFFPEEADGKGSVDKANKIGDFFKSLMSCLSPKSCGKIPQPLKLEKVASCPPKGIKTRSRKVGDETAHATASLVAVKYRPSNQVIRPNYAWVR